MTISSQIGLILFALISHNDAHAYSLSAPSIVPQQQQQRRQKQQPIPPNRVATREAFRSPLWSSSFLKATPMTSATSDGGETTASSPDDGASTTAAVVSAATGSASSVATTTASDDSGKDADDDKSWVKRQGGLFAFDTKYGALNPYGIFWGLTAIGLGIPWFASQMLCALLYKMKFLSRRLDPRRRLSIFFTHVWGWSLLHLTRSTPEVVNGEILEEFYKQKRPAMIVANHCSWLDIPALGYGIGWRNYKMVAKRELLRVPVLGAAIAQGGHLTLDRANRRSQLETLKRGIGILRDDRVHLVTFPEGTRSRTGRLMRFKNGAFKMAHKAGAPVVPASIVGAYDVQPSGWMFPFRAAGNVVKVVFHEPIESTDKTEAELVEEVQAAMMRGLPEKQRPLDEAK